METVKRFYESVYDRRICNQFDHVMPIVGDEGMGKSTFIVQSMILWQQIKDDEHDPDEILNSLIYDRDGLKEALATFDRRSVIAVPDAARVLHKKESMKGEQLEIEKDFFDVRTKEFLVLLGFQDWGSIPSFLQERRAKNVIYIPKRGVIRGYNRESLDKKVENGKWPPADLLDTFPSLEGTDIWQRYQEIDREMKDARMHANQEDDEADSEGLSAKDVVEDIRGNAGIAKYIGIHGGNKQPYIDPDLIEFDYEVSARTAKKAKKVLEREYDTTTLDSLARA